MFFFIISNCKHWYKLSKSINRFLVSALIFFYGKISAVHTLQWYSTSDPLNSAYFLFIDWTWELYFSRLFLMVKKKKCATFLQKEEKSHILAKTAALLSLLKKSVKFFETYPYLRNETIPYVISFADVLFRKTLCEVLHASQSSE